MRFGELVLLQIAFKNKIRLHSLDGFSFFKLKFQQDANAVQEFKSLLPKVQVSEILISPSNHSMLALSVINLVKGPPMTGSSLCYNYITQKVLHGV